MCESYQKEVYPRRILRSVIGRDEKGALLLMCVFICDNIGRMIL